MQKPKEYSGKIAGAIINLYKSVNSRNETCRVHYKEVESSNYKFQLLSSSYYLN